MAQFSVESIEYLQRSALELGPLAEGAAGSAIPVGRRRLTRVFGVGRTTVRRDPRPSEQSSLPSEDLLAGLAAYHLPLAFVATGDPAGIKLEVGTWANPSEPDDAGLLEARQRLVETMLAGMYPSVQLDNAASHATVPTTFERAGMVRGIPAPKPLAPPEYWAPIDRLLTALRDVKWQMVVVAEPLSAAAVSQIRRAVTTESRQVAQAVARTPQVGHPLADHYQELLKGLLSRLSQGEALGLWRSGVYLRGTEVSYHRLASACHSILSGNTSVLEPLRTWDHPQAEEFAAGWQLPDVAEDEGPGAYRHPFRYQTLLTSRELAAYVHLPEHEAPGFSISAVPQFDAAGSPRENSRGTITIGKVVHRTTPTEASYDLDLDGLTRHAFVAGITGAGKTRTIFALLREVARAGVPFLVLEPAKAEYRGLLQAPELAGNLRIFTLGDERISPFRLNPFEVPPGSPVSQHLDLLRAVFASSLGMWSPLPQVMERCLYEVYLDAGWDLATDTNARLGPDDPRYPAFPTLSDLLAKVADVVPKLGYEARITADIGAALTTRLQSLRSGGRGRMLDVRRSIPFDELLRHPTVLELEMLGDDDDKALMMALLLVRLVEHRRTAGEADGLQHVIVIEEAHRLLSAVPRGPKSNEQADPRGKAVETFTHLLAEIRAYGQGVVVADQVPVRLAPEIIKNTGLKIAHRTLATDDREALAGAMAMDEGQARGLTTLEPRQAAVFGDGDDMPALVQMPHVPDHPRPTDEDVRERMARWRSGSDLESVFSPAACCVHTCLDTPRACQAARRLVSEPALRSTFGRLVMSSIEQPAAVDRLWPDVLTVVRAHRPPDQDEMSLLRSLAGHLSEWFANRRGAQVGWSYSATERFATALREMLMEKLDRPPGPGASDGSRSSVRQAFCTTAQELHRRAFDPYPACGIVCDQSDKPLCIYRYGMADQVESGRYQSSWSEADQQDRSDPEGRRLNAWVVCQDAGYQAIEFPEEDLPGDLREPVSASARRASLCFAQQMLASNPASLPRTNGRIFKRILAASQPHHDDEHVEEAHPVERSTP